MKDLQRNLYRTLLRKCRYMDHNPALKNVCLSTPTHLMSLRGKSVERIASIQEIPITGQFIHSINQGAEYHLHRSSTPSMVSTLKSIFQYDGNQDMQSAFEGIKLLNNAHEFVPHLARRAQIASSESSVKLEVMDHLDRALLLKGEMAFIQHPMALDFDRSDPKKKPFETRKVMVGCA